MIHYLLFYLSESLVYKWTSAYQFPKHHKMLTLEVFLKESNPSEDQQGS